MTLELPEHGRVHLPLAGIGGRGLAAIIDLTLLGFVTLFILLGLGLSVFGGVHEDVAAGLAALLAALLPLLGPLAFELTMRGQTPGKRLLRLRVVSADGRPAGAAQLVWRNVLRLVDFLPVGYSAGAVAMFFSARGQRLGDLAAGTLVVREDDGALDQLPGLEAAGHPDLHGISSPAREGLRRLLDPGRVLDAPVREARLAELLIVVRRERPDLAPLSDQAIVDRLAPHLTGGP